MCATTLNFDNTVENNNKNDIISKFFTRIRTEQENIQPHECLPSNFLFFYEHKHNKQKNKYSHSPRSKSYLRKMFFMKEKFSGKNYYNNTKWESNAKYVEIYVNKIRYAEKIETSRFVIYPIQKSSDLNDVYVYVFNKINLSENYFKIDYRDKYPKITTPYGCELNNFDDCFPIYYRKYFKSDKKYIKKYSNKKIRKIKEYDEEGNEIFPQDNVFRKKCSHFN